MHAHPSKIEEGAFEREITFICENDDIRKAVENSIQTLNVYRKVKKNNNLLNYISIL